MKTPETVLQQLIDDLKKLPSIGEKTATRLAYFILKQPLSFAQGLAVSLINARQHLQTCEECCNFSEMPLCPICSNQDRTSEIICVVEQPSDLTAFEKSRYFQGKYHVLHGSFSPLDGLDERKLKIKELVVRVDKGLTKEIILATNPTVEGDTTALYLAKTLKLQGVKVSRIAHGIPVGSEIEYLDGATLSKALQNRITL